MNWQHNLSAKSFFSTSYPTKTTGPQRRAFSFFSAAFSMTKISFLLVSESGCKPVDTTAFVVFSALSSFIIGTTITTWIKSRIWNHMLFFTFKIEGCGISEFWFKRSNTNLRPRSLTSSPWKRRDFPLNLERKERVAQLLIVSRGEILVSGYVNVYHPGSVDGVRHLPLVLAYHGPLQGPDP